MAVSWNATANQPVIQAPIKTFLCPSAAGGDGRVCVTSSGAVLNPPSDYGPDNGFSDALVTAGYVDPVPDDSGILVVNRCYSVAEVRDGASNTFLVSEDAGRPDRWQAGKMVAANAQSDGGWANRDNEYITHGFDASGTTSIGPCHTNCTNNNEVYSFHLGGANHVLADGSVKFIRTSMDIRLFVKFISREGGDIVSHDN